MASQGIAPCIFGLWDRRVCCFTYSPFVGAGGFEPPKPWRLIYSQMVSSQTPSHPDCPVNKAHRQASMTRQGAHLQRRVWYYYGAAANRTRVHGNFGRDRNCTDSGMCPVCCKCVSLRKLLPVHTAARLLVPMTKPFSPIKPQERFELPSIVYRTIVLPLHY